MAQFKVGIIGCGRHRRTEGASGFGIGHSHAAGYAASPICEITAAADINQENLRLFCEGHNVPCGYLSHREMLTRADLDIVSVCVWPELHERMVIDAAEAGVRAFHCEKPMAPTWGECKRMVAVCDEHHVQLSFNHQRRFGKPFRKAKELLDGGAIGQLTRLEAFARNLYDWGTHWFDMMCFYNNDGRVDWVIGQIDARGGRTVFGVMAEGQGLSLFRWRNGAYGLMATGDQVSAGWQQDREARVRGKAYTSRLIGTEGVIDVGIVNGPEVRLCNADTGGRWQEIDAGGRIHGEDHFVAAIVDVADALRAGREPELSARKALQATELIFATYESSPRRGRVDIPLNVEDSPFLSMLESGTVYTEV
jgi:UDP-N-acetylglucosamine 3-dehydrogenase